MSRMHRILFFLCSMVVISIAGCSLVQKSGPDEISAPKEVLLTESDGACGSGVGLDAGDTLVLILEDEPSDEKIWEVGFYVPAVIKPSEGLENQQISDQMGLDETNTFRFLATGEGQATLRLIYHNPSDADISQVEICDVTVMVAP